MNPKNILNEASETVDASALFFDKVKGFIKKSPDTALFLCLGGWAWLSAEHPEILDKYHQVFVKRPMLLLAIGVAFIGLRIYKNVEAFSIDNRELLIALAIYLVGATYIANTDIPMWTQIPLATLFQVYIQIRKVKPSN